MKRTAAGRVTGLALAAALVAAGTARAGEFPRFEYHKIAECGRRMGQTSLVDIDKDGDLDWVVGCNGGDIWWFEYKAPDEWVRHAIGTKAPTDVGGTAFDVDGDGWIDQVSGAAWFGNTHKPRSEPFQRHANGAISTHDNVAADVDGDGDVDICSKPWNGSLHVYLRNLLVESGGKPIKKRRTTGR